ncbi:conserved hypothetical protein, partial [Ricinus communis]
QRVRAFRAQPGVEQGAVGLHAEADGREQAEEDRDLHRLVHEQLRHRIVPVGFADERIHAMAQAEGEGDEGDPVHRQPARLAREPAPRRAEQVVVRVRPAQLHEGERRHDERRRPFPQQRFPDCVAVLVAHEVLHGDEHHQDPEQDPGGDEDGIAAQEGHAAMIGHPRVIVKRHGCGIATALLLTSSRANQPQEEAHGTFPVRVPRQTGRRFGYAPRPVALGRVVRRHGLARPRPRQPHAQRRRSAAPPARAEGIRQLAVRLFGRRGGGFQRGRRDRRALSRLRRGRLGRDRAADDPADVN